MGARLSGPSCGKEKNMAKENIENVFLTPDDIPGAAVKNEIIGKLIMNQLKFWLECQRINQSGNKQALYKRLLSCCACCCFFVVAFVFAIFVIPVQFPHFLQGKKSQFHARN